VSVDIASLLLGLSLPFVVVVLPIGIADESKPLLNPTFKPSCFSDWLIFRCALVYFYPNAILTSLCVQTVPPTKEEGIYARNLDVDLTGSID
jgi:hypothetical protein